MWDNVGFGHGVMDDNRLKELDAKGGGPKKVLNHGQTAFSC